MTGAFERMLALASGRATAIRARFICKAMDAALTAELNSSAHVPAQLWQPRVSYYQRVRAYVRAGAQLPGGEQLLRSYLLRPATLPFDGAATLVGFGAGSTVFRL